MRAEKKDLMPDTWEQNMTGTEKSTKGHEQRIKRRTQVEKRKNKEK